MGNTFEIIDGPKEPDPETKAALDQTLEETNEPFDFSEPIPEELQGKMTPEELKEKIRDAVKAGRYSFQCAFCDQPIEQGVMALILVNNWDKSEEQQSAMQSFCHTMCMLDAVAHSRRGHGLAPSAAVIPGVKQ